MTDYFTYRTYTATGGRYDRQGILPAMHRRSDREIAPTSRTAKVLTLIERAPATSGEIGRW